MQDSLAATCIYNIYMYSIVLVLLYVLQLFYRPAASAYDQAPVLFVLPYSKGFICSSGSGTLHLFEKTEDPNSFKKVRPVSIWVDPADHMEASGVTATTGPNNDILALTLSPSEENVICTTRSMQIYSLTLSVADLGKVCIYGIGITLVMHNPGCCIRLFVKLLSLWIDYRP